MRLVAPDKETKNANGAILTWWLRQMKCVRGSEKAARASESYTMLQIHMPAPTEPVQLVCDGHFGSEELTNHYRLNSHFRKCKEKSRLLDWRLPMGRDYIFWLWKPVPSSFLVPSICSKYLMPSYWGELNWKMKMKQDIRFCQMIPIYEDKVPPWCCKHSVTGVSGVRTRAQPAWRAGSLWRVPQEELRGGNTYAMCVGHFFTMGLAVSSLSLYMFKYSSTRAWHWEVTGREGRCGYLWMTLSFCKNSSVG